MDIQQIKETISIEDVCGSFDLHIEGHRSGQRCPFCGGSRSFSTKRNSYFKCYRCNLKGSVIDFVMHLGRASTVGEAIKVLNNISSSSESSDYLNEYLYKKTINILYRAFDIYKQNKEANTDVWQSYTLSRGWSSITERASIGLASPDILRNCGMSDEELTEVNLLTDYGEYYDNHLIFPVYNKYGQLVHFSGRALDDREVRWKSSNTKGQPPIHKHFYNSRALFNPTTTFLVVCEGVSDCLSMLELGVPCIGQFGINVNLTAFAEQFSKFDFLIFMYDFDRYALGTEKAGQYKSWSQMMPEIINLCSYINTPAFYMPLPNIAGIKDVNDWLKFIDYDYETYRSYGVKETRPIHQLALKMYRNDYDDHWLLWKLFSAAASAKKDAEDFFNSLNISPSDYLLELGQRI